MNRYSSSIDYRKGRLGEIFWDCTLDAPKESTRSKNDSMVMKFEDEDLKEVNEMLQVEVPINKSPMLSPSVSKIDVEKFDDEEEDEEDNSFIEVYF